MRCTRPLHGEPERFQIQPILDGTSWCREERTEALQEALFKDIQRQELQELNPEALRKLSWAGSDG